MAAAVMAWLLPVPGRAQDNLRWTTNYYPVAGDTLPAIQRSLGESRPWKSKFPGDGQTDWRVTWRFSLAGSPDGCRVQQFTTTTTIAITLPRWPSTNAAPGVIRAWERYLAALGEHEAGHAKIGLAAAAELSKRIQETGPDPSCDSLKEKINRLGQQILEDYRKKDRDYDQRTDHGATQGARLLVRMRPEH